MWGNQVSPRPRPLPDPPPLGEGTARAVPQRGEAGRHTAVRRALPRVNLATGAARDPAAVLFPTAAPQAVRRAAAARRFSSSMLCSRMRNFCTLPVTVIGKLSTNLT